MTPDSAYTDFGDLPGKLFVVEGIDGSGKSTQLDLMRKWLISLGYCAYFSEWNSSPVVRETTKYGKSNQLLSPLTFCLIHAADFADRLERTIVPPLRAGAIVLADRYIYTAFARDAARGMDRQYVRRMYRFAVKPTVAFYFNVPLKEALNRILSGRPQLKYYEAGMDLGLSDDPYKSFELFQASIQREYDTLVDEFGLAVIDATLPIVEQQRRMRELVRPHLDGSMRRPTMPDADLLAKEQLSGRYLAELQTEWRHT